MIRPNLRSYDTEVIARLTNLDNGVIVKNLGYTLEDRWSYPIYSIDKAVDRRTPKVLISAGIHGDEPAGVYALLDFIDGPILRYVSDCSFIILPCLNPWGFEYDKRTNRNGLDINRSFMRNTTRVAKIIKEHISGGMDYLFALSLHEDNTDLQVEEFPKENNPKGLFIYESTLNGSAIGPKIIGKLDAQGFEICRDRKIYSEDNYDGVIYTKSNDGEFEQFLEKFTDKILVTETPTCWALEQRIKTQIAVITHTLDSII